MFRVRSLTIRKFRSFLPDSHLEIGERITLIAGINGTSKSTLLGMISQPLGFPDRVKTNSIYTDVYRGIDLSKFKALSGGRFKADFSEVFRVSEKFDRPRTHDYTIFLVGDGINSSSFSIPEENGLDVRSEFRNDQSNNSLRFVTNTMNRERGAGNFPHPVIYLGLERLRPLSTLKRQDIIARTNLGEEEIGIWEDIYRHVMISNPREKILPEQINTGNDFKKSYQSVETASFDAESASAGQDNLGQIITAVISFHRLRSELAENYQGGVLLIDEFDATLHPIAQKLLLQKLVHYAEDLNLQIISTTHSLFLLQAAFREFKDAVSLIYLEKKGQNILLNNNVDYDFIASDLAHISQRTKLKSDKAPAKTSVLFEDHVAADFFRQVTKKVFDKYISIYNTEESNNKTAMGNDVLKSIASRLATRGIPELEKLVFVLDPDSKQLLDPKNKRLLALPGEFFIEKETYRFLIENFDEVAEKKLKVDFNRCFAEYNNIERNLELKTNEERKREYKRWFKLRRKEGTFGKSCCRVFELWCSKNLEKCKDFSLQVLEALLVVGNPLVKAKVKDIRDVIDKKFANA